VEAPKVQTQSKMKNVEDTLKEVEVASQNKSTSTDILNPSNAQLNAGQNPLNLARNLDDNSERSQVNDYENLYRKHFLGRGHILVAVKTLESRFLLAIILYGDVHQWRILQVSYGGSIQKNIPRFEMRGLNIIDIVQRLYPQMKVCSAREIFTYTTFFEIADLLDRKYTVADLDQLIEKLESKQFELFGNYIASHSLHVQEKTTASMQTSHISMRNNDQEVRNF
jgi:hypothetical protein